FQLLEQNILNNVFDTSYKKDLSPCRSEIIDLNIIVNAKMRVVNRRVISYWDVVHLAYEHAENKETSIYSVDYAKGPISNPEGSMVDGQYVQLTDGMIFYVTQTDKS
ncbi:multiubiquitin domain-containing protein, partial [Citrobacter portucalensis]|uniref:multiubiquitin domain-containing protein n=1 Tax=Citrobacter portucalensis TaxID=1639133 RepID=UPI00226B1432